MGKGLAIAGFVCSLVGLVLGFLSGIFSLISFPLAVVGLVLAIVGRKKLIAQGGKTGIATAGFVMGIIAVCITAIAFFTCGICILAAGGVGNIINQL